MERPYKFLVVAMWFINLKSAVYLNLHSKELYRIRLNSYCIVGRRGDAPDAETRRWGVDRIMNIYCITGLYIIRSLENAKQEYKAAQMPTDKQ